MEYIRKQIPERVQSLWERREDEDIQLLLDFEFVVADKWTGAKSRLRVSRAVMSLMCEAFARMFAAAMQESSTGRMLVEDCSAEGFSLFVGCLHGVEPKLDASNVVSLLQVADKYCHTEVKQLCRHWIRAFLDDCDADADSFISLLLSLKRNSLTDKGVDEYLADAVTKGSLLFEASNFYLLSAENVETMLKQATFGKKTEEEVFERCVEWAKMQLTDIHSLDEDVKMDDSTSTVMAVDNEWTTHFNRLIPSIRFPLMSAPFLCENRQTIEALLGANGLIDVLFQKEGCSVRGQALSSLSRIPKTAFDIWSRDWIIREPKYGVEPVFSVTAKKDYAFISTEVNFVHYSTEDVRFAFELEVGEGGDLWIEVGVAADISQFRKCQPFRDADGEWDYKIDCWSIGSTTDEPFKKGESDKNRVKGKQWDVAGSVLKVEMVYNQSSRCVHFKAWLKEEDFTLIYDFDIEHWPDPSCFCPFLCIGEECVCKVTMLS